MAKHDLIQCGDHKWAPWSIVCTHLVDGTSKDAVALHSSNPEVDYDWLCRECYDVRSDFDKLMAEDKLKAVCMHCTRIVINQCDQDLPDEDEDNS